MNIIYLFLVLFSILIVLLKRKKISLIVIYLCSTIIYYFNAFSGIIYVGHLNSVLATPTAIHSETYIPLIINIVLISVAIIFENNNIKYMPKQPLVNEKQIMKYFLTFVFVLSVALSLKYQIFIRTSFDKAELAEESTAIVTYYKYLASFIFVYMYTKEGIDYSYFWKGIATIPIITTFFFGNRSYLIISILAIVMCQCVRYCYIKRQSVYGYIKGNRKIFIGLVVLFCVTLLIKGIYAALFIGNFELVMNRIGDSQYYQQVMYVSEPNTIMTNLDSIVHKNYQISPSSYLALWAYFVPFLTGVIEDSMGIKNFTLEYQKVVYASEGVTNKASTYIGETFANGGYIMSFIIIAIYLFFLVYIFKKIIKCRNNISMTTFLLIGIDGAFYIQRNSMAFEFSRFRCYIYICLVFYFLTYILNKSHRVFKK